MNNIYLATALKNHLVIIDLYKKEVAKELPDIVFLTYKNELMNIRDTKKGITNVHQYFDCLNGVNLDKVAYYLDSILEMKERLVKLKWHLAKIYNNQDNEKYTLIPECLYPYSLEFDEFMPTKNLVGLEESFTWIEEDIADIELIRLTLEK